MDSKKRKIIEWESLSKWDKGVMVVMLPIFAVVAGAEHIIAKLTGATYNEVNIIVYYLLIPLSWAAMVDYTTKMPFLSIMYIIAWILFLWKDPMKFRERCDWAFTEGSLSPAVSTKIKQSSIRATTLSRVVPSSRATIAIFFRAIRFRMLDFPALVWPISATTGNCFIT